MTRHFPLMVVCLAMAPLVAVAQGRYQPRGYQPCPTCEALPQQPTCEAPPPCKPPCNPPPQQQMPMMIQQPGVFVQPPASGTVQGPIEQSGIEGATVTFPELSLRMPSIRFPAKSRSRQNARMLLDQQYAPYIESPPIAAMPAQAAPPAAPAQPMVAAAPQMQMMMAPAAAPQMQMMMVPMQMAPQQQYYIPQTAPQQNPAQQMNPPQPEPDNNPTQQRNPTPSCDARGPGMAMNAAEDKIRQLEMAEQLLHRMESLRRQLQQAEAGRQVPTPTPDLGARATQLAPTPALRPTGIQPVQPVSQQPQRPIVQPLPTAASIYNERPASYTSEPQYMSQYQQPVYSQPQATVIREPQASITGMRAR